MSDVEVRKGIFEHFMDGVRKGWNIFTNNMFPSIVMAYMLIQVLQVTGLMDVIARVFQPVMAIFGLPGIAMVALVSGFFSKGGGCATAALLFKQGSLTAQHCTILLPAIVLFGGLLGQWVRIVVTAGVPGKRYGLMFAVAAIDSILAMWVMKAITSF